MTTESFWYVVEQPQDRRVGDAMRRAEDAPVSAPMKPVRRTKTPSTDQKRRIRRSSERHTAIGPAFNEVDWDELHPRLKDMADNGELHRGIGINLPDDLHRYIHDPSVPQHERAVKLLDHISDVNGREPGDHRLGLGMHWSLDNGQAEHFAGAAADHHADYNKDQANGDEDRAHDFSWGKVPGDVDIHDLKEHLSDDHGIDRYYHPASNEGTQKLHTMLHRGGFQIPGQEALFPEPPRDYSRDSDPHVNLSEFREPDEPRAKPGTEVVLHTPIPAREDIEENPQGHPYAGGDVYHPEHHGEAEVPIRPGATIPITGISWREHPHWADTVGEKDPEFVHHRFDESNVEHREASKTATVLNTQIERLNAGDRIRTPTGQSVTVKKLRPHETDSTLMYLDTDMGTSTVKRGTNFQTVPYNAQQQELPNTGNPMASGNTGQLPGQGRTPGGPGSGGGQPQTLATTCPNCGNANTLHLKGNAYICSVCGYSVAAGGTPGGLMFTDQPKGVAPPRRKPGEVPRAHVWASKYITDGSETQIARRARQVLGGEE